MLEGISTSRLSPRPVEAVVQCLASSVGSRPGTWCAVDVLGPGFPGDLNRKITRLAEFAGETSRSTLRDFLSAHYPPDTALNHRLDQVLRTGEPLLISRLAEIEPEAASYLCVPLTGGRDEVLGAMTLVSDRVEFETQDIPDALRMANATAALLQTACEYDKMRKEIAEMRDWISILAHELKTPLTPLNMQAGLIRRMIRNFEPGAFRSAELNRLSTVAEITDKQVHRINSLVNSLLEMTRIDSGHFSLKEDHVSLNLLAQEVIHQCLDNLDLPQGLITLHADQEVMGYWDGLKIEQVLNNLLSNAVKYGGGKPIHVSVDQAGGRAFLRVADQGPGICRENHERIFKRFQRLEPCNGAPGLGLGLYISREIIRQHGGDIHVSSEAGKGSVFTVELPLDGQPCY